MSSPELFLFSAQQTEFLLDGMEREKERVLLMELHLILYDFNIFSSRKVLIKGSNIALKQLVVIFVDEIMNNKLCLFA